MTAEVLALAARSLASFGTDSVLKISNMDFVVGMLEALPVDAAAREQILALIRRKNQSDLKRLLAGLGLSGEDQERISQIPSLYGAPRGTLERAAAIAATPAMKAAADRLARLCGVLEALGYGGQLRLDFSMVNDIEYYNGIIFQGFLEGLPRLALSGGQYDGMMAKLGKDADAIGFAIYLKELD